MYTVDKLIQILSTLSLIIMCWDNMISVNLTSELFSTFLQFIWYIIAVSTLKN